MRLSPQLENGYVKIANELLEALCGYRIPGEARQVFDAIIRQTYGFNRKSALISISKLKSLTNLSRRSIQRGIDFLIESNLIIKKKMANLMNTKLINIITRGRRIKLGKRKILKNKKRLFLIPL